MIEFQSELDLLNQFKTVKIALQNSYQKIESAFTAIDANNSGKLEYEDFEQELMNYHGIEDQEYFQYLMKGKSGLCLTLSINLKVEQFLKKNWKRYGLVWTDKQFPSKIKFSSLVKPSQRCSICKKYLGNILEYFESKIEPIKEVVSTTISTFVKNNGGERKSVRYFDENNLIESRTQVSPPKPKLTFLQDLSPLKKYKPMFRIFSDGFYSARSNKALNMRKDFKSFADFVGLGIPNQSSFVDTNRFPKTSPLARDPYSIIELKHNLIKSDGGFNVQRQFDMRKLSQQMEKTDLIKPLTKLAFKIDQQRNQRISYDHLRRRIF